MKQLVSMSEVDMVDERIDAGLELARRYAREPSSKSTSSMRVDKGGWCVQENLNLKGVTGDWRQTGYR